MNKFSEELARKRAANFKSDIVAPPPPKPPKHLGGRWFNEYQSPDQSQTEPYRPPAPPQRGDRKRDFGSEAVYTGSRWEMVSGFERRGEKIPQAPTELIIGDSRGKALGEIYSRVNRRLKNDSFEGKNWVFD